MGNNAINTLLKYAFDSGLKCASKKNSFNKNKEQSTLPFYDYQSWYDFYVIGVCTHCHENKTLTGCSQNCDFDGELCEFKEVLSQIYEAKEIFIQGVESELEDDPWNEKYILEMFDMFFEDIVKV